MVKNLILAGALIMCLAHTEALTDNDECRFEDKYFTLSNIKSNKNQDTTCQEDCAKMNYCLLWQYDGSNSCTLTVLYAYTMNHGTSKSGITNCNSGDVASCGEKQIVDTISGTRVDGIDSKKACEEKCLDLQNCLLWRFATEGGERRCFYNSTLLKMQLNQLLELVIVQPKQQLLLQQHPLQQQPLQRDLNALTTNNWMTSRGQSNIVDQHGIVMQRGRVL